MSATSLVPFDNAVILERVEIKKKTVLHIPGKNKSTQEQDISKVVLRVVRTGPGKRLIHPEAVIAAKGDPDKLPRLPMNCQVGDLVLVQQAFPFAPDGPEGKTFWISVDDALVCKVEGLELVEPGSVGSTSSPIKLVQ